MLFPPAHAVLNSPFMILDEKQVPVSARSVKSKFPSATMLPYTRREFAKLSLAALPGAGLLSAMNRLTEFREKYEAAGVLIEIGKVDGIFKMTDDELDYAFALAKALCGRAISTEISHKDEDLKRLGQFADKHKLMVGYHGHATTTP